MNGLKLNVEVFADDKNAMADALQALAHRLSKEAKLSKESATDEWYFKYDLVNLNGEKV